LKHTVTLIPGDGVGPEVIEAARRVLEATEVQFQWQVFNAGETALEKEGSLLPDSLIASIKKNKIALKGPTTTPVGTGFRSVNVALRKTLEDKVAAMKALVARMMENNKAMAGQIARLQWDAVRRIDQRTRAMAQSTGIGGK